MSGPSETLAPALKLALLRGALEEVPFGLATLDGERIHDANGALARIWGTSPGSLDGQPLSRLFDEPTLRVILAFLGKDRAFGGRLDLTGIDGREFHALVTVERYRAGSARGGFLVVRDLSFERSVLSEVLESAGGGQFRVQVDAQRVDYASPALCELLGIPAHELLHNPACLAALVGGEDRRRLAKAYQRLVRGESMRERAEVALRTDQQTRRVCIHAAGRRNATGRVPVIEGIVLIADRASTGISASVPPPAAVPSQFSGIGGAMALLDVCKEALRSEARLSTQATGTLRDLKAMLMTSELPDELRTELLQKLDRGADELRAATALGRRVRRAMDGTPGSIGVDDALQTVRATLAPLLGEAGVTIQRQPDASLAVQCQPDELLLAMQVLALRACTTTGRGCAIDALASTKAVDITIRSTPDRAQLEPAPASVDIRTASIATMLEAGACSLEREDLSADGAIYVIRTPRA